MLCECKPVVLSPIFGFICFLCAEEIRGQRKRRCAQDMFEAFKRQSCMLSICFREYGCVEAQCVLASCACYWKGKYVVVIGNGPFVLIFP